MEITLPPIQIDQKVVTIDDNLVRQLLKAARACVQNHYSILEKSFPVGAALVMADDPTQTIWSSSNSEMSVLNGGICAERSVIHYAVGQGFRRIKYLALTLPFNLDKEVSYRAPCGLCRQTIAEFSDDKTLIFLDKTEDGDDVSYDVMDMDRLLPYRYQFTQK